MLKKLTRKNYIKLIIAVILLLVTAISLYGCFFFNEKCKTPDTEPVNYNDLIVSKKEQNNVYVSVKINGIPVLIAEQKSNYVHIKYYILYDKNHYTYVAKLSEDTYKKIEDAYKKHPLNFSYTLTGYVYKTPDDLKKIIIDTYNESNPNDQITYDDYANYFGSTYFDDEYTKYTTQAAVSELATIVSAAFMLIFLFGFIRSFVNTRKTFSKINKDEIESELAKDSLKEYKGIKIYLTDKYFISTYNGLHIFSYVDICWMYTASTKSKLSSMQKVYANIFTKDKIKYKSKKVDFYKQEIFDEIFNEISIKNHNIMLGYSYENMDTYKKIVR